MSVLRPKLSEAIPERPACSLQEFDHHRVIFSIVDKAPQIFALNIIGLVAKDI